jgi:hypothetical protein
MIDMNKAYRKMNPSSGEKYQGPQKVGNDHNEDKAKGTMEKPIAGSTHKSFSTKNIMDQMKYAPKTVSYSEFTDAKRNAKLQSMAVKSVKDGSSGGKMEDSHMAKIPHAKNQKSFDIDVTSYKPRQAKGKA